MKIVEFSSNIPEENISFDEILLKQAEKGEEGEAQGRMDVMDARM